MTLSQNELKQYKNTYTFYFNLTDYVSFRSDTADWIMVEGGGHAMP